MSAGTVFDLVALSANDRTEYLAYRPLKRKFDALLPSAPSTNLGYPSPPMSSPPSPPRQSHEPLNQAVSSTTSYAPAQTTSTPITPPLVSAPPTLQGHNFLPPTYPVPPHDTSFAAQPRYLSGASSTFQGGQIGPTGALAPSALSTSATSPLSTKTVRKSKAHVASACVNCKKAHLSCDVARPCARCVASNKQDSCTDVAHKKRGRPRLRDDGEFKIEQILPGPSSTLQSSVVAGPSTPRPIAGSRHRRTESLRSLRSQTSEYSPGSSQPTPIFAPPPSRFPPAPMPPPRDLAPSEIPTAFLNLDLVVVKANSPFKDIISLGREVNGTHIGELVIPADGKALADVRNDLRAERESREPLYMAPIARPGQDELGGVSEADIERLCHSFVDRGYTWARNERGSETFPARVRLGKADTYFVVVTLPSFRPDYPPTVPPQLSMPAYPPGNPQQISSYYGHPPAPQYPSMQYPPQYGSPQTSVPSSIARAYGTSQMPSPYPPFPGSPSRHSAPQSFQTIQQPIPGPSAGSTPFPPSSTTRVPARQLQAPLQLPALLNPTTEEAGPSRQPPQGPNISDEEEEDGRKKRRKVDISDVLQ